MSATRTGRGPATTVGDGGVAAGEPTPPGRRRAAGQAPPAGAGRAGRRAAPAGPGARWTGGEGSAARVGVVYNIDGPRVRLGLLWFLLALASLAAGRLAVAGVYGAVAAVGAAQAAVAWRRAARGARQGTVRPNAAVAAAVAAALPLAAAVSTALLGAALLAGVAACLLTGGVRRGARTLQCAAWVGGAAASVVVAHRYEPWAAVALILVVSAYEVGDFIVGSGAGNRLEGPIAGAASVLVVQFCVSAFGLPPFKLPDGLGFAALAAVLCPAGQLAASLVLPSAAARAPALRRLDSLLLLGPAWASLAGLAAQA